MGSYQGSSITTAFPNVQGLDIFQVINEGGRVVWNLNAAGAARVAVDDAQGLVKAAENYAKNASAHAEVLRGVVASNFARVDAAHAPALGVTPLTPEFKKGAGAKEIAKEMGKIPDLKL